MRVNWAFFGVVGLLMMGALQADVVDLVMQNERQQYLLYEPLVLRIAITNNSGEDLVFEDPGNGRSWLDFVVVNDSNQAVIRPDHPAVFPKFLLPAGQTRILQVNVTPLYNIRETGNFHIQTVLQVAGREFVTEATGVTIVNGQQVWQKKLTVDGSLYTYSLIRFTQDSESTYLYLRVEDEAENKVFCTERLGEVVSFTDSQTVFDSDNNLHILHVNGRAAYRYTRVNAKGDILNRENFVSVNDSQPQLFKTKDGSVLVQGGRKDDASTRRELLSAAQSLIRKAPNSPQPSSDTTIGAPSVVPPPPATASTSGSP